MTNWPEYEANLRQRGSLTVWFTEEAITGWRAPPRTTAGGLLTALTLRTVFRLALCQTEGLIGSVLGLTLRVSDHSMLSRRAASLKAPQPTPPSCGVGAHDAAASTIVWKASARTRRIPMRMPTRCAA